MRDGGGRVGGGVHVCGPLPGSVAVSGRRGLGLMGCCDAFEDEFAVFGVVFVEFGVAASVDGGVELAAGLLGGEAAAQQVEEEAFP